MKNDSSLELADRSQSDLNRSEPVQFSIYQRYRFVYNFSRCQPRLLWLEIFLECESDVKHRARELVIEVEFIWFAFQPSLTYSVWSQILSMLTYSSVA